MARRWTSRDRQQGKDNRVSEVAETSGAGTGEDASAPKGAFARFVERVVPKRLRERPPVVAVVRMQGAISASSGFRQGLSMASIAGPLEKAFSVRSARAVAILINSPGGSPVQSTLIHKRIRALAHEKERPVVVFCEDVAASGGYLIAIAGDEIFADRSSIVGSIGVISAGFGFVEAIGKLGVERRVYTSGEKKMTLDPFSKENSDDVARLKSIQKDVHEAFKSLVRERRAEKIAGREDELFTGEFWAGEGALERGLIDGIGDLRGIMRQRYGDKVRLRLFGGERGWGLRRLFRGQGGDFESRFAGGLVDAALAAVEERALWSRYGL
jgi:signal peptide peptidase SppA